MESLLSIFYSCIMLFALHGLYLSPHQYSNHCFLLWWTNKVYKISICGAFNSWLFFLCVEFNFNILSYGEVTSNSKHSRDFLEISYFHKTWKLVLCPIITSFCGGRTWAWLFCECKTDQADFIDGMSFLPPNLIEEISSSRNQEML